MDVQERIRHYLGPERNIPLVIKYSAIRPDERPLQYCYTNYLNKPFPQGKTTYYQDMTRCLHYLPHLYKTTFLFYPHDRVEGFDVPTLVKSRPIYDYQGSILFNLNYLRHFADVYKVEDADIPYEDKRDVLIWRGADTGYGFGNDIPYRPVSRQTLVETYGTHEGSELDIGLSSVSVNRKKDNTNINPFQKYIKPKVKMQDLLQYKFLLSVEGNDVATNLKWILYSNSVAFCPPFTINSWILEENLQPWEHYVPVRHDFHDLPDKVEWALNHPDQCLSISKQAKKYIEQFLDLQKEKIIMANVLEEYSKNVKIME
jgi:hypothetical protein